MFDQYRQDAVELLANARTVLEARNAKAAAAEAQDALRQLLDGRLTTVVVGEFKRGKSSLVGALIGDPGLFPIDVDITTNLVTSIEYGSTEAIEAYLGPDGAVKRTSIGRDEIPDYVTEQRNPDNVRSVRLLRIHAPKPILSSGLVLLDTPGAGGINASHSAITYAVMATADVAIFVLDALTPLTVDELQLLKSVADQAVRLMVVITKIDQVVDYSIAVRNARLKLDHTLGKQVSERVPIIPVSSSAKLDWLATSDSESLEVSNFGQLESELWNLLTEEGGAILVNRAMGRLIRMLDELSGPLEAELIALTSGDTEIDRISIGLREQQHRLADLAHAGASWRRELINAFGVLQTDADIRLGGHLDQISSDLEKDLVAEDLLARAETVRGKLERDVTVAWSGVARDVRGRIADLCDGVEAATGLRLNPSFAGEATVRAFESVGRPNSRPDQQSASAFAIVPWLGNVLATVMVNPLVAVVGQVVGFFGSRAAQAKRRRTDYADDIRDLLIRTRRELTGRLAELIGSAERSVMDSYAGLIASNQQLLDANEQALRANRVDASRPAAVQELLAELAVLRTRAATIVGQDPRVRGLVLEG